MVLGKSRAIPAQVETNVISVLPSSSCYPCYPCHRHLAIDPPIFLLCFLALTSITNQPSQAAESSESKHYYCYLYCFYMILIQTDGCVVENRYRFSKTTVIYNHVLNKSIVNEKIFVSCSEIEYSSIGKPWH